MKRLILAGIVIIICCLVFLIVRQNSSQADIDVAVFAKPYTVSFGDWVYVYLVSSLVVQDSPNHFFLKVKRKVIEGKFRFSILGWYNAYTESGKRWYQETFPKVKEDIRQRCIYWTEQGYPISLNDFQFDIRAF